MKKEISGTPTKISDMKKLIKSLDKLSLKIDQLRNRKDSQPIFETDKENFEQASEFLNKGCMFSRAYCTKEEGRCMCKPYLHSSLPSIKEAEPTLISRKRKNKECRIGRISHKVRAIGDSKINRIERPTQKTQHCRNTRTTLQNKRNKKYTQKDFETFEALNQLEARSYYIQTLFSQNDNFEMSVVRC
ncbi:unnamed protein product [Moneuplotes crassus]|uniref:Uncharacterized protein n=1 Tax=Euplotes crassus TaxID=5936 RepID=A0AAD2D2D9_EUPCR|nr:unnamed protein product [Moneuplotes crassus]